MTKHTEIMENYSPVEKNLSENKNLPLYTQTVPFNPLIYSYGIKTLLIQNIFSLF